MASAYHRDALAPTPVHSATWLEAAREARTRWSHNLTAILAVASVRPPAHRHGQFDLLGPVGPGCSKREQYGRGDEAKRSCALSSFKPCRIISLGNNQVWGFEADIVSRTHCSVDVFDCTVPEATLPPLELRGRVRLHHACIDETTRRDRRGRVFLGWSDVLRTAGITGPPSYLKMDIEGFEYRVLRSMLRLASSNASTQSVLPTQIAMEVHSRSRMDDVLLGWGCKPPLNTYTCTQSTTEIGRFMDSLWREGRYWLVDRHDNRRCSACTEVLLVRDKQLLLGGESSMPERADTAPAAAADAAAPAADAADAAKHCATSFPAAWSALHERRPRTVAHVCDPKVACGGLGDRMAGIITVAAYALATNRTALVMDEPLLAAFRARHRGDVTPVVRSCHRQVSGCSWLQREQPEAHLGLAGNGRCELCRWLRAPQGWGPLLRALGLHLNVPLAASCLLHGVLSPQAGVARLSKAWLAGVPWWVGVHMRTFSLTAKGERGHHLPPDAAAIRCAAMAVPRALWGEGREGGALALGDSPAITHELSDALSSSFVNVSSSRTAPCHVDGNPRANLTACMLTTAVDWLGLSSARLLISSCPRGRSSGFVMYSAIWGYAEQTASAVSDPPRLLRTGSPGGNAENGSCWSVEQAWNVTTDGSWLC